MVSWLLLAFQFDKVIAICIQIMTCRTDDAMWYTSADVKDPFFMPEPLTSEFKSSPIPEQLKNGISCIRKVNQTMLFWLCHYLNQPFVSAVELIDYDY